MCARAHACVECVARLCVCVRACMHTSALGVGWGFADVCMSLCDCVWAIWHTCWKGVSRNPTKQSSDLVCAGGACRAAFARAPNPASPCLHLFLPVSSLSPSLLIPSPYLIFTVPLPTLSPLRTLPPSRLYLEVLGDALLHRSPSLPSSLYPLPGRALSRSPLHTLPPSHSYLEVLADALQHRDDLEGVDRQLGTVNDTHARGRARELGGQKGSAAGKESGERNDWEGVAGGLETPCGWSMQVCEGADQMPLQVL